MLTVAVVSANPESSSSLRACLQQSGLVQGVRELAPSGNLDPRPGEAAPDVILLDLGLDVEPYFATAASWRRRFPAVRVIGCAPSLQLDSALLLRAMRSGVQEFLPKPVDPALLRDALVRFAQEREANGFRRQDNLILVVGAKGGVGTSTVAVNLGVQLVAQAGRKRVLLLDLARPLGHLSLMLDLKPRFGIRDAIENLDHLDGHFLNGIVMRHKSGVEVLAGTSHAEQWEGISGEALGRVASVAQNSCDFVFVDGGVAGVLDCDRILQTARAIVLVTAISVPALWALERRVVELTAQGIDPARIRVLINRWRRGDEDALQNIEKRMKHPIFARLPNDFRQVSEAENLGITLSGNHNNVLVDKFRQLASQLTGVSIATTDKPGRGGFFSFAPKR
jgi:pilus assembly protein CpaE